MKKQPSTGLVKATSIATGVLLSAGAALADVADNTEPATWAGAEQYGTVTVSNGGGGLVTVSFAAQDPTQPPTFVATDVVSGGDPALSPFAGNYVDAKISHMAFKIRVDTVTNALVTFVLKGGCSGCLWKRDASLPTTAGTWVTNIVSLRLADGWRNDGAPNASEQWDQDIRQVEYVGVRLIPGGRGAQAFAIDSFILVGSGFASSPAFLVSFGDAMEARFGVRNLSDLTGEQKTRDTDRDGMSDVNEILAGTNPDDQNSVFAAQVVDMTPNGVKIRWPCVEGGVYTVSRTSDLIGGNFGALAQGYRLTATTTGYMEFTDATANKDGGPYFYRIVKE